MRTPLPLVLLTLATTTITAQNWTVGVPAAYKFSEVFVWGGGCYPGPDQNILFSGPDVFGMQYYAIVDAATPPGTNTISPYGLTPLNVGDTVELVNGALNSCFFPTGSGSMTLSLWMIGTPTTAGMVHPCTYNDLWMSNLMICPEGLSTGVDASCTVQAGTVGLAAAPTPGTGIELPSAANGWNLRVTDATVTNVELVNACGSVVASAGKGSIGTGTLPDGLYFAHISTANGTRTERFVIAR